MNTKHPKKCYTIADSMGNFVGDYRSFSTEKDAFNELKALLTDKDFEVLNVIEQEKEVLFIWEMTPHKRCVIAQETQYSVELESLK